ncbi:hypothetical protein L2E82_45749 [Cichorium intybus]|uniref:Uncharacterized protein n=1 Tax=Cichorium intybus TaxID=13427 RepID=A0ACB8ZTW1_CICIN|nr:hypothetical protein L2E82_45749 [Cichorium intybus]
MLFRRDEFHFLVKKIEDTEKLSMEMKGLKIQPSWVFLTEMKAQNVQPRTMTNPFTIAEIEISPPPSVVSSSLISAREGMIAAIDIHQPNVATSIVMIFWRILCSSSLLYRSLSLLIFIGDFGDLYMCLIQFLIVGVIKD